MSRNSCPHAADGGPVKCSLHFWGSNSCLCRFNKPKSTNPYAYLGVENMVGVRGFEPLAPASRRPEHGAKLLMFGKKSPVIFLVSPIYPT